MKNEMGRIGQKYIIGEDNFREHDPSSTMPTGGRGSAGLLHGWRDVHGLKVDIMFETFL